MLESFLLQNSTHFDVGMTRNYRLGHLLGPGQIYGILRDSTKIDSQGQAKDGAICRTI